MYAPWPGFFSDILRDMDNLGVFPLDPESPVTEFRLLAGDAVATPTEEIGEGQFELWSDGDIELYMSYNPDNVYRAIASAFTALAGQAAVQAKTIKDYDLQVNMEKRSDKLLSVAAEFNRKADRFDDELNDNGNHFFVSFGHRDATQEDEWYNWGSRGPRQC